MSDRGAAAEGLGLGEAEGFMLGVGVGLGVTSTEGVGVGLEDAQETSPKTMIDKINDLTPMDFQFLFFCRSLH